MRDSRERFETEMRAEYNVQHNEFPGLDWFTWQIAWHAATDVAWQAAAIRALAEKEKE